MMMRMYSLHVYTKYLQRISHKHNDVTEALNCVTYMQQCTEVIIGSGNG